MGNKQAQRRVSASRVATFLAALGALVMSSGVALMVAATPANAAQAEVHKSYVCKYVDKPGGGTELLQTGQNPIWVDNHSIAGKDVVSVGDKFKDAQGFSLVIVANTPKLDPEPGIDSCPGDQTPPPPAVCPEGTDNAGQEIPEGQTAEEFCNDVVTPPTVCPEGTDNAGQEIPEGQTAEEFCNDVVTPPTVCPEGTDNAGQEIPEGQTAEQFCANDTTVVSPPTTETESQVVVATPKTKTTKTKSTVTPTVVEAGLVSTSARDLRGEQGLVLMVAGMVMLVAAGGLGLRIRSVARI